MSQEWSNLSKITFKRTYARNINEFEKESFSQAVERTLGGNLRGHNVPYDEINRLRYFMMERKAGPAGRGYWFSGTDAHQRIGGVALSNCWFVTSQDWMSFVVAQDLLMLGGGVGMSVEHKYTSKLPKVKKNVKIVHRASKDTDFIVPDSREGWCELTRRILESFFVTGKSFSYSTVCVRGYGERIGGFGGVASGPLPLISFADKMTELLQKREGKYIRPIDAADMICAIGEMVVAGNVRRSAILIMGDAWDKDYLRAKRWDLGPIPTQRSRANYSIACEDIEDVHPLFWKTYEQGEAFGIVNVSNIQKYGRMGELKKDAAIGVNPCVPAGTRILTRKGYIPIDELVGQSVEVWNGFKFSRVIPQITGENQPLVTVHLSSGQSLTCTPVHNWVVQDDCRSESRLIKTEELEIGTKLAKFSMPVMESGVNNENAYSQGFYSGDGSYGTSAKTIWLYGDKKKLAPYLSGNLGNYNSQQDKTSFRLNFTPFDKEFVPFEWNLKSRLMWLAGLLDADGTELKEGGSQIASVNRQFLLDVQLMLTTLGVNSKVTFNKPAGETLLPDGRGSYILYKTQELYRILIGSVQIQELKQLGMQCQRLKFQKTPQRDATRFVVVTEIEDAGTADKVYCFKEPEVGLGTFEGIVTGQCGEATLEPYEPCNLQEIALPNLNDEKEFIEAARLMHRWGKRVTVENYHHPEIEEVIKRNRRIGTGITGCLQSNLFNPETLDRAYQAIQEENLSYSKELGIGPSIRTTLVKPSGTMSKVLDVPGEGIHPGFSRYMIQRIRFSSNDKLIPLLREAGHHIEPEIKFDGTSDHGTQVVDFYIKTPDNLPIADENWDTWKQLDVLKMAQKHWADQAVSVTVYYRREEIPQVKAWLADNLKYIKTISFLCHNEHGFKQAPKEAITQEQYDKMSSKIKPIDVDKIVGDAELDNLECAGGACPVK